MSVVLGLNEFFHDTAAALVVDGRLVALMEQERLDRRKHAPGFALMGPPPWEAVRWCLDEAGLDYRDVDRIAVSFDADQVRAAGILADLVAGNLRRSSLRNTIMHKLRLSDPATDFLGGLTVGMVRRKRFLGRLSALCQAPVEVVDHHRAHAASAFVPTGWDHAGIVVLDGMGDATPTSTWEARGTRLRLRSVVEDPSDSIGVLYRTISLALGFSFMDAGKTMGLAAYGEPREPFLSMMQVTGEGYRINWAVVKQLTATHGRFSGELGQDHKDMAASVQARLEEVGVHLARRAVALSGSKNLCLAGGVALNCNMNSRILAEAGVDAVFVQPGAMDQGGALGAAWVGAIQAGDTPRPDFSVYGGPSWSDADIEGALRRHGVPFRRVEDPAETAADLLARRRIVAWFQGGMEFGPRALGARSMLANPDRRETGDRVNALKGREAWRPLAPAILEEHLDEWFVGATRSPYMTLTFPFRQGAAERVLAVVHHDGTARIQTVSEGDHPEFRSLIQAFHRRTGIPIVLNTSFNRRGEPIVCTPEEAIATFRHCGLDDLVIGSFHAPAEPAS